MHDLVIRNGLVADGSGAPARRADVAVDGETIAAVGAVGARGRREIDADGLLVTPGFVDIHTHYDGQATWDPMLTPSSWHGVTTAVFGNCGVGFAPVRPGASKFLINLMEGVEDIPETVLSAGVRFDWESFPEYMDRLAAMPRALDVGAQVPHAALRFYVMGERGADHREAPTDDEIARMGALLEQALAAGALGFSTSRTTKHRTADGRPVGSLSAQDRELLGLALAMKRARAGVLEVNSDFGPGEFESLARAAQASGRPLSCLMVQVDHSPDLWRETLAQIRAARAGGLDVNAQVGCRPIGVLVGFETTMNPFATHPAWKAMAALSPRERHARLAADPALRRRLVEERPEDAFTARMNAALGKTFVLGPTPDYEPDPKDSIASMARARGLEPWALLLELLMADDGRALLLNTFENYFDGDLEVVREMLTDDATVIGVADAGAHVGLLCDGGSPTTLLTHWARDRVRGPRVPLEYLVLKQTRGNALAYGLADRGLVAPGLRADLNVIDHARLRLAPPQVVYDLPAGGRRLIQRASGYRHTFVRGVETLRDDEHTGALPGRLVRGARAAAPAAA